MALTSYILVGKLGGVSGIQGSLKVISWCDPKANIFQYDPWYIFDGIIGVDLTTEDELIPYQIVSSKLVRSNRTLLVNFQDIDSIEKAQAFIGKQIYIAKKQLIRQKDEYFWHELIGMRVVNEEGILLGTVANLIVTGAHDVLKIISGDDNSSEQKKYLIPYVNTRYIISVDRNNGNGVIKVSWDDSWTA